ncbi:TonB-dependent receptor [Pantoea sp. 18069]|uniref:TonB-dependent receptor n=1 Tax=Pantoea sp. 18069 TaxID=2681415 RepID=UPI0013599276|nr:TonB-dependent receptor [Pantoea sp. 18069]
MPPLHSPPARLRPAALAVCLHGVLCLPVAGLTQVVAPPPAPAAAQLADAGARAYQLVAGPLDDTLNRFARQAGITLSFTPQQVTGLRSRGLEGRFSVETGLAALLAGSGYVARAQAPGHYVLQTTQRATSGVTPASDAPAVTLPLTTVTARRDRRQEVFDTPGSLAVVTREDIDRLPPRNTSDVLADVPGVYTSQGRQSPGVSVNLRGMQDFGRVNVMIDGTRQNYQQSGHGSNGAVYLDPELLGGVDITKGPSSTVGGAGMIAGTVNFRTLEAEDLIGDGRSSGSRVNTTTGTNAYDFSGSLAGAWRLGEDGSLLAAVGRKKVGQFDWGKRNYRPALQDMAPTSLMTGQDQWSALLKATTRLTRDQELKLSYIGLDARFSEGARTADEIATASRNQVRSDTVLLNHHWTPDSPLVDLRSSLYFTRTQTYQQREASTSLDYGAFQIQYETNTVGATVENTARLKTGAMGALVKTGGEFFHDWTRPQAQPQGDGQSLWFTGATPEGRRTVASAFSELTLLYGDWLEASAGLRYDWYGLQGEGQMYVGRIANPAGVRPPHTLVYGNFDVDRHAGAFAPKLSIAARPIDRLQLFASYGQGLRPAAITESLMWGMHVGNLFPYYPNPGLREERSRNAEIGANLMFDGLLARGDKLRLKTAWFDTRVENYIAQARIMSPISVAGGGTGPMAFVNLQDPTRFRGLELQAEYDAGPVFASLSYTRTLIDTGRGGYDPFPLGSLVGFPPTSLGQSNGADIWYVLPPARRLMLGGGVRLLERKLTLGARLRDERPAHNRSQWITADATPWRVYDLWAAYELNPQTTVRLALENVRDDHYIEMNGTSYMAGPGRTVLLSMTFKF